MDFDWSKPMIIDWSGRSGPLIKEEDLKNSVIKRILRNQYYAPFCEREYIRVTPWWSPEDPFGTNSGNNHHNKNDKFIPGLQAIPAYPQLSTLNRQQHHHGLRVLGAKHNHVQPKDYPQPNQKDYQVFEEIQELYFKEQKEYIKWAKQAWVNGDCIRALRPKPGIEKVYEAEFKMRALNIQSLPVNYALAAQIPLETKNYAFELQHKENLMDVDVQDLPIVDYPEEMESTFSILKTCAVPEPCAEHPCKFILPNEDSVSVLPLTEIHRELAQYAVDKGASFIASENSLRCLLETERTWKIPVSVVEVICPEGDLRRVVVLGSEFDVQKECATQRTYRAYRHLLRHRFAPSTIHYKLKTPCHSTAPSKATSTHQIIEDPITPRSNRFECLDGDLAISSDEDDDRLQIDDDKPRNEPERLVIADGIDEPAEEPDVDQVHQCEPNNESDIDECTDEPNNESDDEPSSELDQLMIDDNVYETTPQPCKDSCEPNYGNNTSEPNYSNDICEAGPSYSNTIIESNPDDTSEACIKPETSKPWMSEPNYGNYTNEPCYSFNRDAIHNTDKTDTNNTVINKPSYSNDTSESCDSEPDNYNLRISKRSYSSNTRKSSSSIPDTGKPWNRLIETKNFAAPNLLKIQKHADLRLFESNEEASSILFAKKEDAALSLLETNKDAALDKPNTSDTKTSEPMSTEHDGPKKLDSVKPYRAPIKPNISEAETSEPTKVCSNETMTSDTKTCEVSSQKAFEVSPKKLSPIKPCAVAVRKLSLSEAYNVTGHFNEQKTTVTPPNSTLKQTRKRSATGTNTTEVAGVNTLITAEKTNEVIPKQVNPLKPVRNKSMSEINANEIAVDTELIANEKTCGVRPMKCPVKRCIMKPSSDPSPPKISARKLRSASIISKVSICETEANSKAKDDGKKPSSNQTATVPLKPDSNRRARKLSKHMSQEYDYCTFGLKNPGTMETGLRKLSIREIKNYSCKFQEPTTSLLVLESNSGERSDTGYYQPSPGSNNSSPGKLIIDDDSSKPSELTRKPGVRRLSFNETIPIKSIMTKTLSLTKPIQKSNSGIRNLGMNTPTTTNGVKKNTAKLSLSELFGDESDSDEPICRNSDRNITVNAKSEKNISATCGLIFGSIKTETSVINNIDNLDSVEAIAESNCAVPNTRNLTFGEPGNELRNTDKSLLKPCLRKSRFIDSRPRNGKRTLSLNDLINNDSEIGISFSEPDRELAIAGFDGGVAVSCANRRKNNNNKQKEPVTCTYGLRSSSKAKPATAAKKTKTTNQTNGKEGKSNLTKKDQPKSNNQLRNAVNAAPSRSRAISTLSNFEAVEDSDSSEFSRRISTAPCAKMNRSKTNIVQQKNENVGLRKSLRLSSRLNAEDRFYSHTNKEETTKTNIKENTDVFRKSQRLSVRSTTKENVQPKTNKTKSKTNVKSLASSFYKITKKGQRRMSLPANIFSNSENINQVLLSNSVTSTNEIVSITKESHSNSCSNSATSPYTNQSIELSEQTKRYFLRSANSVHSETDQSEDEISERMKRYINRSMSPAPATARPDYELKQQIKKYTRRPNSIGARKTEACSNGQSIDHKDKLSERTKKHIRRSMRSSYTSCQEKKQPTPIRKKKTKRNTALYAEIDRTASNKIDSTSDWVTTNLNKSLKTEAMDITENQVDSTNHGLGQPKTNLVNIYLYEKTSEYMDENDILQIIHIKTKEEEHLSETENVVIDSQHITLNSTNASMEANNETIESDQTKSKEINQTKIDQSRKDLEPIPIIQRGLDFANTEATDLTKSDGIRRSRKLSISDSCDSSDYFDNNETEELNMFHFTAVNVTDSEEESEMDNSQIEDLGTVVTETDELRAVVKEYQTEVSDHLTMSVHETSEVEQTGGENIDIAEEASEIYQPVTSKSQESCETINNETNELNRDWKKNFSNGKIGAINLHHETLHTTALSKDAANTTIGVHNCVCKGTLFEIPPPRSYKKWQVRNTTSNVTFDLIVHSSHKVRKGSKEVLLEPIVEYQPELGGTELSTGKIRSLALSLMLRESAGLLNVRVDHESGNVIVVDAMSSDKFTERHGDHSGAVAGALHTACDQLRYLMPGRYVLAHDLCHGANAMLYTTKGVLAGRTQTLSLRRDNINMPDAEDAIFAKIPPELGPALLPYHKHRMTLPLCFTPYKNQVREDKRLAAAAALARARPPPQAIQWPKKKKKSKKTRHGRPANSSQ